MWPCCRSLKVNESGLFQTCELCMCMCVCVWMLSLDIHQQDQQPSGGQRHTGYEQIKYLCIHCLHTSYHLQFFFDHLCKCLSIASHSRHIKTPSTCSPSQSAEGHGLPFACPNKITGSYLESSTLIFAAVKPFTAVFFPPYLVCNRRTEFKCRHSWQ